MNRIDPFRIVEDGLPQGEANGENQRRAEACVAELRRTLERYNCLILGVAVIGADARVHCQIQVVPKL